MVQQQSFQKTNVLTFPLDKKPMGQYIFYAYVNYSRVSERAGEVYIKHRVPAQLQLQVKEQAKAALHELRGGG